jgi:hypothetical protein
MACRVPQQLQLALHEFVRNELPAGHGLEEHRTQAKNVAPRIRRLALPDLGREYALLVPYHVDVGQVREQLGAPIASDQSTVSVATSALVAGGAERDGDFHDCSQLQPGIGSLVLLQVPPGDTELARTGTRPSSGLRTFFRAGASGT